MQVRYRNTLEHLVALQKYTLRNTDIGKKMMLHRFLTVEVIIIIISVIFAINHDLLRVLLGFLVVSGLAWLFRERSVILQFKKDFKRERRKEEIGTFDKDRILRIDAKEMTVQIGLETTSYTWDEIQSAGQDRKFVYIVLKGVLHYVIPQLAFADQQEADLFLNKIQQFMVESGE